MGGDGEPADDDVLDLVVIDHVHQGVDFQHPRHQISAPVASSVAIALSSAALSSRSAGESRS